MIFGYISTIYRFIFLAILSLGLIIVDHRSEMLQPVRALASILTVPFYTLVDLPDRTVETIRSHYPDDSVYQELENLKAEHLKLQGKLQTFDALVIENHRLTRLLATARRFDQEMTVAKVIKVGLDPVSHRILIDQGAETGVFVGQPVIVPDGVVGQITDVNLHQSVVTLVTDRNHAIPVQVQRNGLRTIVQGAGEANRLSAPYLLQHADIRKGDILVTSGMGGRFPVGQKVAEVDEIIIEAKDSFLKINAITTSKIDFIEQVLLVWERTETMTSQ